jgi:acetoin utilization deacetylase AcuC-like enzyme
MAADSSRMRWHAPSRKEVSAVTLLYRDDLFLQHHTGMHPERPERLRSIHARLDQAGLPARCVPGQYTPLSEEAVCAIHQRAVLECVRQATALGGGYIEADTVVSPASLQVALAAAGACVSAVDAVLGGSDCTALCLVRPPGHHATPAASMGFCLFNNIALAAHHARTRHELNRVLIVDWDVHHGNGTQDIFYADGQVSFLSIHRYGHGFYPGTGAANETGTGRGLGATLNVPLPYNTLRRHYVERFTSTLQTFADKVRPELVLLSAGFDAHRVDPVGSLGLESEDFATLTRLVRDIARVHCGGRLVSCLEGGYDLHALAESVQIHLETLLA